MLAHQLQVVDGGTSGTIAGRRLHPVGSQIATNLALTDFVTVFQVAIVESGFHLPAGSMCHVKDSANVLPYVIPLPAEHLRNINWHVQFFTAVANRLLRLAFFDRRGMPAVRKADGRAGF